MFSITTNSNSFIWTLLNVLKWYYITLTVLFANIEMVTDIAIKH